MNQLLKVDEFRILFFFFHNLISSGIKYIPGSIVNTKPGLKVFANLNNDSPTGPSLTESHNRLPFTRFSMSEHPVQAYAQSMGKNKDVPLLIAHYITLHETESFKPSAIILVA